MQRQGMLGLCIEGYRCFVCNLIVHAVCAAKETEVTEEMLKVTNVSSSPICYVCEACRVSANQIDRVARADAKQDEIT